MFTLEKLENSVLITCKNSKLEGRTFWKLFAVFIQCTVRTVIHVACTGPVIRVSLYAFVEFGQKRTVPIRRVFLYCICFQTTIETERFEWLENFIDII